MKLKPPTRTITQHLSDWTCHRLRQAHRGLAAAFGALGWGGSRVIRLIPRQVRLAILLVMLGVGFLAVAEGGWRTYSKVVYCPSADFEEILTELAKSEDVPSNAPAEGGEDPDKGLKAPTEDGKAPAKGLEALAESPNALAKSQKALVKSLDTFFKAFNYYASAIRVIGWVMIAAAVVALIPHWIALLLLRVVVLVQAAAWLVLSVFIVQFPRIGAELYAKDAGPGSGGMIVAWQVELWLPWLSAWLVVAAVAAVLVVYAWMGTLRSCYYRKATPKPLVGDRVYDNVRTHGKDPTYRTSLYWPLSACVLYLVLLLLMMLRHGCGYEPDYEIPFGSGTPTVTVVQVKRIKRKKPEKLVLNMDSPIIWKRPKLTDINVLEDMLEETSEVYVANKNIGRLGAGGGNQGGWPYGVANARVRFIRLKYNGENWDWNKGHGGDYNMLLYFNKITGFKIAPNTEHKEIDRLALFRKGKAPPFVYMTGTGRISISARQARALKKYCLEEGGMIVADSAGGAHGGFDRYFVNMCRQVFSGMQLVDIPDDDPLYREPFVFPNGAPPLWHHHGRYRPLGIKHEGRWVVFYHPGDMGDAWKTGHSGASKAVASRAYKLGINIMYYTFTRYLEKHHPKK